MRWTPESGVCRCCRERPYNEHRANSRLHPSYLCDQCYYCDTPSNLVSDCTHNGVVPPEANA